MTKLNELELQSKTIDWLRFPLIILVIFIHIDLVSTYTPSSDNPFLNPNNYHQLIRTIAAIAVPCFFMFSGYFFFNKTNEWNKKLYFLKIRTRLRTLLIPYILFNLAAIVCTILLKILKADGSIYPFLNELLDNCCRIFLNYRCWTGDADNINMFGQPLPLYGPYLMTLWFVRDLFVMALISPIVYHFVKYTKIWGLGVLFFFFYTKIWIGIPGYSSRFFLTAFFFFSMGAYFSVNRKNLVITLRKYQVVWLTLAFITLALSAFCQYNLKKFVHPIFILSGVISVVNITSFFMERGKLRVRELLSKASFFVYCTHNILILHYVQSIFRVGFRDIFGTLGTIFVFATYFIVPFVCAGVTLCIYLLMKRFMPRILRRRSLPF